MRRLLLGALLLAGAAPAVAQEVPNRGPSIAEPVSGEVDSGSHSEIVWVQTDVGSRIVIDDDTRRTYVGVSNLDTGSDVTCVNSGFPSNAPVVIRLRGRENGSWNGQAARYAIRCVSMQGARVQVDDYTAPADNDPDSDLDANPFVVDPTPEPEPTPTPTPSGGSGPVPGPWQPDDPVYLPTPTTPTPTPSPVINADAYPGGTIDQATPTPSPTPVEIVED